MTKAKTILTPRGKRMTPARYVALVAMKAGSNTAKPCASGHFDCAAWDNGPCEHEVAAQNGLIEEDA